MLKRYGCRGCGPGSVDRERRIVTVDEVEQRRFNQKGSTGDGE